MTTKITGMKIKLTEKRECIDPLLGRAVIEVTLSNRDPLQFRLLLGREALIHRVVIDPTHVLVQGKISHETLEQIYL